MLEIYVIGDEGLRNRLSGIVNGFLPSGQTDYASLDEMLNYKKRADELQKKRIALVTDDTGNDVLDDYISERLENSLYELLLEEEILKEFSAINPEIIIYETSSSAESVVDFVKRLKDLDDIKGLVSA